MCGGGTSQTSTVSIPPEVLANYQKVFGRAEQIAEKPFQAYSTDPNAFVAGLTPTQQAAMQNINAIQGMASGDVAAGQQMIGAGTEAGAGLQQASLGTAAEGQGIGSQLYGKSMGTSEAGLGAASQIYGQAIPQISQAAQTGQRYGQDAAQNLYAGVGLAKPYMGEAANLTRAGLGAGQQYASLAGDYLGGGTQNVGVGDLNTEKYMSPYLNQVVKATQALQAQENETQRSALKGDAIRAGAFGGDRAGVAQANLARQQSMANQSTLANILQQGYSQAQGVAGQQQQLGLSADQANRAAQQFGAQQASAMGQQQFGQMATAAQQQAAIGQALYGQNLGQGQAIAGLGQQLYGQQLGAAQAEAGIGKDIYGMSAQQAQLQQAAAQGMFGQAAQVAALQQGAGNNVFNYGLQGGQGVANLGLANQQAQTQAAQAQMQMGQIQQQTDQAGLTALYNQFTQQQGFPYQQAQFLGNLAMGTGALSGSTTTTTGSSGGIFSDRRLKENIEKIGKTYDGQPIYRYNYKGEKATQIGLMADESDKKAVGQSQGYKTLDYKKATEKAADRGHFYEGGLVPASMGGAVNVDNAYEEYNRGGYVSGGMVETSPDEDGNPRYQWVAETPEQAEERTSNEAAAAASQIDPRINDLYQKYLFRDPEAAGAATWQQELDRGASIQDIETGIANSRERNLVNQAPLTYDASKFQPAAAPVVNRYGAASAPMGSYASSFQPQPSYAPAATGGYGQQAPQYGYGPQMGYGQPQASGKGPSAGGYSGYGGYQQPSQMSQFNQGYGGSYLSSPQASGKGVGPSSYQSNYGYSNPSSMGAPAPQASGKGPSTGSSTPSSNAAATPKLQRGGRTGYLAGGIVDPNDLAALAAQRMAQLAPHAAGMPGQTLPGAQSSIPNKLMHVPKLITSNARLPEQANPFNQAVSMAEKVNSLGKLTDKGNILAKDGFLRKTLDKGIQQLPQGARDTISSGTGSTPAPASGPAASAPSADRAAPGAKPVSFEGGSPGEFYVPEYDPSSASAEGLMPDDMSLDEISRMFEARGGAIDGYERGGLVPGYALGGTLPYGGTEAGGGYIPEDLLEQQKIQGLPRDNEQLKAAAAKATSGGSGGLGDVMKAGNLGYKLAPEGMKAGLKSMFAGTEAAAPAAVEGLGAAAPAAAEAASGLGAAAAGAGEAAAGLGAAAGAGEAAAGLGTLAGAGEAAAGLGSIGALAGEAAAGIGAAASAAAPIAAAGAEGLTALLAFLPFLSDRRAKENIEPVGKTYDGQTIYRYNYKGDEATQIGLIAQEVEKRHKDAVGSSGGLKTVDYKRATEDAADRGHFYNGGLIPYRRGYADGMAVEDADLPAVGAQDAARLIDERAKANFEDALRRTLAFEGGYTVDTGGPTMAGISSRANPDVDLARVARDPEYKSSIYRERYWNPIGAENMDAKMAPVAFDTAVNLGVGRTKQLLQQAADDPQKLLELRQQHYDALIRDKPEKFGQYERGWKNRVAALSSELGGESAPRPSRDVPDRTAASQAVALAKQPSTPEKKDDGSFPIRPPTTARGKEQDWGDFLTSKQFILPALTAIGTMGTTPTRDIGTALAAGLLGGVTSYQNLDKSLAELEKTREEIPKVTTEAGEIAARTKAIEAGLYERQYVRGVGEFVIDKSNPLGPRIQITDKNLKPLPNTGFESNVEKIPYSKDSPRPDGKGTSAAGEAGAAPVLNEDTIPKLESKNAVEWNSKIDLPEDYLPKEHLNIELNPKEKQVAATKDVPRVKEYTEKASSAKEQLMQIEAMQRQYDLLSREGFLTPGAAAEERLKLANSVNTFLRAAGAEPIFDTKDAAALESMMKDTFRLGATLSNSIGTREPGVIVQQAVRANPGIENSPDGFRVILAGMKENAQYMKDRGDFYSRYFDRFGHLSGADRVFEKTNPSDMYARRAVVTAIQSSPDLPANIIDALKQYGPDAAPKDKPELSIRNKIDGKYGAGTTDYILGKR